MSFIGKFCECTFSVKEFNYVYEKLSDDNINHISQLNNKIEINDSNSHYNDFLNCIIIHKQKFKAYLKLQNKDYNKISRKLRCGKKFLKKYNKDNYKLKNNDNIQNYLCKDIENNTNNYSFLNNCFKILEIVPELVNNHDNYIKENKAELNKINKKIKKLTIKKEKMSPSLLNKSIFSEDEEKRNNLTTKQEKEFQEKEEKNKSIKNVKIKDIDTIIFLQNLINESLTIENKIETLTEEKIKIIIENNINSTISNNILKKEDEKNEKNEKNENKIIFTESNFIDFKIELLRNNINFIEKILIENTLKKEQNIKDSNERINNFNLVYRYNIKNIETILNKNILTNYDILKLINLINRKKLY